MHIYLMIRYNFYVKKRKNKPPTNKEKDFRKDLVKFIDFNHPCYDLIRSSKSKIELQTVYIYELQKRNELIRDFCGFDKINYNKKVNFFEIFDLNDINKSLSIVENYFNALHNLSYNFELQDSLAIKHISLKELLCGLIWQDRNLDTLEDNINNFYKYNKVDDEKLFFEVYYKGACLGCYEGYELYDAIRNDVKDFIVSNNLEEYKNLCKKWYENSYDEAKVRINPDFLQDRVEEDIFSDLKITLVYLRKANLYDKYIDKLRCAYINRTPLIKLKNRYKNLDITQHNFPNFIVNLDLNFNLPLETLKNEIEVIYDFIHNSNDKDYNILFEKDIVSKRIPNLMKSTNNKNNSTILNCLKEKYCYIENINDSELKINIEFFVLYLFIFDCQLVGMTQGDIEDILNDVFGESLMTSKAEYISKKAKIYSDLFDLIINKKYLTYTTGLNTDEILPQWCSI